MTSASAGLLPTAGGVTVERLAPGGIEACSDDLLVLHALVFSAPPWSETVVHRAAFAARLRGYAARRDVRTVVVRGGDGGVVGFAIGQSAPDVPRWAAGLEEPGLGPAAEWLRGQLELVELAVHPDWRRCGVGSALHDAVLRDVPHRRAWLTSHPDAEAVRFYRSRGWRTLEVPPPAHGRLLMIREPAASGHLPRGAAP